MRAKLGLVAMLSLVAAPQACAPAERATARERVGHALGAVGFSPTGSMTRPRGRAGAVRLLDGRVLVVGGATDSSVDIYDPATGSFSQVTGASYGFEQYAGFGCADCAPAGVTLASGKVLLPGLYWMWTFDPSTGMLASGPGFDSSYQAHVGRALTRLADGRVLVTGGAPERKTPYPSARTAALFGPASGTSGLTGEMADGRLGHTATLLADGRVLVAGGLDRKPLTVHASAELYDPVTGVFTPTGAMAGPRRAHSAHRLPSGKVLVAGGVDAAGAPILVAELYDPSTGTFAPAGQMVVPRRLHRSSELLDGRVLFTGGIDANDAVTATAEIYDPVTGSFAPVPPMTTARRYHTATTLLSGEVLIAGSWARSDTAEIFDPTEPDAGPLVDAGTPDAGGVDAGAIDAGASDAGAVDAGVRDAAGDAPPKDAGGTRFDDDLEDARPDEAFVGGGGCGVARDVPLARVASVVAVAALASVRLRRRARASC